jgi:drug/metabolite transporter (DMT)-like permease
MNWFWFALLSAVCFATFSILVRLTLKDQGDAQAFAPIANAIVGFLLLGIAWFEETFFRPQFWDYILLVISSIALAGASYLIIWARQITPVSQISLVQQLAMVWTFIGGIWLLSETLNVLKVLSMGLIVLGTGIVFFRRSHLAISKGITLGFFATFFMTINALISKILVVHTISPALYSGIAQVAAAVLITVALPDSLHREYEELKTQPWQIGAVSVFMAGTIYFLMRAYQVGEASQVTPVRSSAVLLSVLAGIVFLKERASVWRKIVGASVVFLGAFLLQM